MKKLFLLLLGTTLSMALFAQKSDLKVETFTLDNGLKVIMAEEHSSPQIFGGVLVHTGSKNENPEATGVAHYFEHIMFKGTDRIGTIDWEKEKVYLDSISDAYDRLHATKDEAERHNIQLEINRLNIAANKYAIPNEVDAILQGMGCTGLNAGTSYDYTVYYNALPSNQLENWMDVYVERFRNPIFRLFQSELEAIYEEKNMYENQQGYLFTRNIFTESFGEHPYSRDVIGYGEHLKNPQPSEMQKFFETYYVANNMELVLVGDFNIEEAKEMVRKKFGTWRSGKLPVKKQYRLPAFDKRVVKEVKQSPIPMGIMVFPGIPTRHEDELALQMLSSIVAGSSGPLAKASTDGRILGAELMPFSLEDAGSNIILYVPKLIGQSHEEAEQIVWNIIDSIKNGYIDEDVMEAVKMRTLRSNEQALENMQDIAGLLQELALSGSSYEEWLKDNERWQQLTKEDVIAVAKKYFDANHCTIVRSKMGFPQMDGAVKPDWEHLEAQNQGAKSEFAKMIESNVPEDPKPQVIDFEKDVTIFPINKHFNMYAVENPKNDIFYIDINYNYNSVDDPDLDYAVQYFNGLGAGEMDLTTFNRELDKLGADFYLSEGHIHISGFEKNMEKIIELCKLKLQSPRHDPQSIKNVVDGIRTNETSAKSSSDMWFDALNEYVLYGENSEYLRHTPYKEWQKRTGEELAKEVMKMFTRNGNVSYSGNIDARKVAELLVNNHLVLDDVEDIQWTKVRKENTPTETQVFYCSNKKFLQSDMNFLIPGGNFDHNDQALSMLFNEYFGGGMNSIVFQEIREFRSLGYSTYGYFNYDWLNRNPSSMRCFLGTQCDKTLDGYLAMKEIVEKMPLRQDKLDICKKYIRTAGSSQYYDFRSIPYRVCMWKEFNGFDRDMRAERYQETQKMEMEDIQKFHDKYIKDRPFVVFISGNAKKMNLKELSKYGKVTEVKYKDMMRF